MLFLRDALVDLVVAFPVMLAFHAAAMTAVPLRDPERRIRIIAGLTATLAWFLLLRFGSRLYLYWPAAVPWVLAAVTVAGTCVLESRLARRVRQIAAPVRNLACHLKPQPMIAPLAGAVALRLAGQRLTRRLPTSHDRRFPTIRRSVSWPSQA